MKAPAATLTSGAEVRLALRQRAEIGLLDVRPEGPFARGHPCSRRPSRSAVWRPRWQTGCRGGHGPAGRGGPDRCRRAGVVGPRDADGLPIRRPLSRGLRRRPPRRVPARARGAAGTGDRPVRPGPGSPRGAGSGSSSPTNRSTPTCRPARPRRQDPAGSRLRRAGGQRHAGAPAPERNQHGPATGRQASRRHGGSRGVGFAIAAALAGEGTDLALLARDPERLGAAARQLAADHGRRVLTLPADTTDDTPVRAAIARTADELGGVDILVNNAAIPAAQGSPRALADELGPGGVNVTVVHPGLTAAERTAAMIAGYAAARGNTEAEAEASLAAGISAGRIITAAEVADVVAFLASPRSVAIDGNAIAAGGGAPGAIHY